MSSVWSRGQRCLGPVRDQEASAGRGCVVSADEVHYYLSAKHLWPNDCLTVLQGRLQWFLVLILLTLCKEGIMTGGSREAVKALSLNASQTGRDIAQIPRGVRSSRSEKETSDSLLDVPPTLPCSPVSLKTLSNLISGDRTMAGLGGFYHSVPN